MHVSASIFLYHRPGLDPPLHSAKGAAFYSSYVARSGTAIHTSPWHTLSLHTLLAFSSSSPRLTTTLHPNPTPTNPQVAPVPRAAACAASPTRPSTPAGPPCPLPRSCLGGLRKSRLPAMVPTLPRTITWGWGRRSKRGHGVSRRVPSAASMTICLGTATITRRPLR